MKLVNYEDYTEMHDQQNIKILSVSYRKICNFTHQLRKMTVAENYTLP